MGVGLAVYTVGFNALLWLARAGLSPAMRARVGAPGGWIALLLGPLCLLLLCARMRLAPRPAMIAVAAASLATLGLCAGV